MAGTRAEDGSGGKGWSAIERKRLSEILAERQPQSGPFICPIFPVSRPTLTFIAGAGKCGADGTYPPVSGSSRVFRVTLSPDHPHRHPAHFLRA